MKDLIKPLILSLALSFLIITSQSGTADKLGESLLQHSVESTSHLQSIEFEVEVHTKVRTKDVIRNVAVKLTRPNFARVVSSGTDRSMKTTITSDGKQMTTLFREDNQFLRSSVDLNGGNIFTLGPVEAAVFFNPDLMNRLPLMGKGIKRIGTQLINGVQCDVLKVISPPKGSSFTIYTGPDGLLRGTSTVNGETVQESRVKKLHSNSVFASSVFAWNPPAGVKPYEEKSAEVILPSHAPDDDNGLLKVGAKAPNLLIKTLGGASIQLAELFKQNKATLVNFWFVGCPPCREELPHLNKMYLNLKSKGFTIIAINVQDDKPEIAKFWKKSKFSIPAGLNGGSVAQSYQVSATPTNYVVGNNGKILAAYLGYDEQGIRAAVLRAGVK